MPNLLMLASGVGLVAATAALWVQGWRRDDHRFFAGLISIAVTLSLFSVVAWAATAIAPSPLTWVLVGTLALLFALRLYRELQEPPPDERSPQPRATRIDVDITWPVDPAIDSSSAWVKLIFSGTLFIVGECSDNRFTSQ